MDIDLSIERMLIYEHIYNHPASLLTPPNQSRPVIPNFRFPPYVIDFGSVVIETSMVYTVTFLNYGPIAVDVRLAPIGRKSSFVVAGFDVQYRRTPLPVGEVAQALVIFQPTWKTYPKPDVEVCDKFYFEVSKCNITLFLFSTTV